MRRTRPCRVAHVAVALALAAVASGPRADGPTLVEFGRTFSSVPYDVLSAAPPSEIVLRVAAILANILGVPPLPPVLLRLYGTRAGLRDGLVRDAGVAPATAVDLAATSVGLALPRAVLLLVDGDTDDRVRLVAHEVAHVVQLELAGPTAWPAQWMMEGTAEWAALAVLDRLGAPDVHARRRAALTAARRYLVGNPAFTPAALRQPAEFTRWRRRTGDVLAYQVAYTLADHVVRSHGIPGVVRYFRTFRQAGGPGTNFERAFATSPAAFIASAREAIRRLDATGHPTPCRRRDELSRPGSDTQGRRCSIPTT